LQEADGEDVYSTYARNDDGEDVSHALHDTFGARALFCYYQARNFFLELLEMIVAQTAQAGTDPVILKESGSEPPTQAEKSFRYRNWSFTLNNYTEDEIAQITHYKNAKMSVWKEKGESGTPHLQGYVEFKNGLTLRSVKKHLGDRIHFETSYKCRAANLRYTQKEGGECVRNDFPTEYVYHGEDLPDIDDLYPWELDILDMLEKKKTSNRNIVWICDETGNGGKSTFGKYLEYHSKDTCYSRISKSNDILTAADTAYTKYYFDFPRCLGADFCPFTALECILDGVVDDCKLKKEPRKLRFKPPWVVVVSNHYPTLSKLSIDRWEIYSINADKELKSMDFGDITQLNPLKFL